MKSTWRNALTSCVDNRDKKNERLVKDKGELKEKKEKKRNRGVGKGVRWGEQDKTRRE